MIKNILITGTIAVAAFAAGMVTAKAADMDKSAIEKIVAEYISNNGGALIDAINAHMAAEQVAAANEIIADHNPKFGPEDAKVTIIEFSEFQCPFCRRVQDALSELRAEYGDRVRFVYKHLPLEAIHPEARSAAVAVQAAKNQGKEWEYMEAMWPRQGDLSEKLYIELAEKLELDMDKFKKDLADENLNEMVNQDMADAEKVGARGTPFFLINGEAVSGAMPKEVFVEAIEKALEEAK